MPISIRSEAALRLKFLNPFLLRSPRPLLRSGRSETKNQLSALHYVSETSKEVGVDISAQVIFHIETKSRHLIIVEGQLFICHFV
jgi:hypothetical protein